MVLGLVHWTVKNRVFLNKKFVEFYLAGGGQGGRGQEEVKGGGRFLITPKADVIIIGGPFYDSRKPSQGGYPCPPTSTGARSAGRGSPRSSPSPSTTRRRPSAPSAGARRCASSSRPSSPRRRARRKKGVNVPVLASLVSFPVYSTGKLTRVT